MPNSTLAQQRRAAVIALLLALLALGATIAAGIVYRGAAWWFAPVFLAGFVLGGRVCAKIFGLFVGAAQRAVAATTNIAGLPQDPMAVMRARAQQAELGKPNRTRKEQLR